MDIVSQEKYVGDIVSSDGKHTKNITLRRSKGIGISSSKKLELDFFYRTKLMFLEFISSTWRMIS